MATYWLAIDGPSLIFEDVGSDAGREIQNSVNSLGYVATAASTGSSSTGVLVTLRDSSGTELFAVQCPDSSSSSPVRIHLDASNNIHLFARDTSSGTYTKLLIYKFNGSGVLQWQKTAELASSNYAGGAVLANGSLICNHQLSSSCSVSSLNSTATSVNWANTISPGSSLTVSMSAGDTSSNVYTVGNALDTNYVGFICKYNSSGSSVWAKKMDWGGNKITRFYGVHAHSTTSVYACGQGYFGSGILSPFLVKFNVSTGAITWQKSFTWADYQSVGYGWQDVATDASENVYVVGYGATATYDLCILAKYNSSGTLQWQRKITGSNAVRGASISVNGSDIYISGQYYETADTRWNSFTMKIPTDGTGTGTYGTLTYAASTYTDATPSTAVVTTSSSSSTSPTLATPTYVPFYADDLEVM